MKPGLLWSAAWTGTASAPSQTLLYRLVAEPGYGSTTFVEGCCGSAVSTTDGYLVGIHTAGPVGQHHGNGLTVDMRVEALFGGRRVRRLGCDAYFVVGATAELVDLRKYVEAANLNSYDEYVTGQRRTKLAANHYDSAISVYELQRSLESWL